MAYWQWNATGDPAHSHVVVCVHGLTRQGRDFDVLARALAPHVRVICPDVAGRGQSDWLDDPLHYEIPHYVADMRVLLAQLHQSAPIETLDWVGTSMGGLIGMALCSQANLPLAVRRLVLNDVGPTLEWQGLMRIAGRLQEYMEHPACFETLEQAADALWAASPGFGPHTREQWLNLSRPMLRPGKQGGFELHYDPAIALPMQKLSQENLLAGEQQMWRLYEQITAEVLLLRGTESDLLSPQTAQKMLRACVRARMVEFAGVGHAPTLIAPEQCAATVAFLLGQGPDA